MSRHPDPKHSTSPNHLSRVDSYVNFVTANAVPNAVTLQEIQDATAKDHTLQNLAKVIPTQRWYEAGRDVREYQQVKQELTVANGVILRAFMSRHHEVLGEELGEYYRKASEDGMGSSTTNRKAAIERVRKLSQKTLDKTSTFRRSSESSTSKTRADEEFVPSFKEDDVDWDTCEDEGSWEEAAQTIAKKDKRYLGIQQQRSREGIMVGLNDTDNEDQEQDRSCGKKIKSARSDKSNKKKKLDEVLEAMPEMIRLASTAAKDHSRALKKWTKGMVESSESDYFFIPENRKI
ncbi:hypothetical protein QZH41_002582 [Actinostola sp. cb2023]|nr:hypothetical protein QZH41_002582 [Actinostola sp. cb2023]